MANATARSLVQRYLRFSSYLSLRLIIPLLIYIPLSFSYALVNLAFSLPFGAKYTDTSSFQLVFSSLTRIADTLMPEVSSYFLSMYTSSWPL